MAIDGYRASQARLQQYLGDLKPGDKIRLSIFRTDRLRDIEITLGNNTRQSFSFVPVANPTELQRSLYRGWMKNEL